ncbi:hypothetical protein KU6B_36240 [Mameliella alba]|uniref:hypothetical protein n=1 Tax=Mameliella alba TaxID=561184 RepID=UPI0013E4E47F|nr:hypothetical protein [Mameliella alba]BBU57359.1 hypothetical protein KU6B_36240 [Mameliella alba]
MKAEEIKDRETLEAWLRERPRRDAVVIAHRAALRVLPIWGAAMGEDWAWQEGISFLPALRGGLVTSTGAHLGTSEIEGAAASTLRSIAVLEVFSYNSENFEISRKAMDEAVLGLRMRLVPVGRVLFAVYVAADSSAAETAAYADPAYTAAYAAGDASIFSDAVALEREGDPLRMGLWSEGAPDWFTEAERKMMAIWESDPADRWDFWRRWWEGAKTGRPIDPELQLAIVKGIDDETWKDPDAVAKAIAKIEEEFGSAPEEVDRSLQALPASSSADVQSTRHAMIAHREDLPPTLDNILGYISLEIDRLQSRNYRDAEDAAEAQRQIRVLTTIHVALSRLETLVPDGADMPEADAELAEKLTRLVFRRFREWPRAKPGEFEDNTADLADSAYRAAMVGGFAYLAPMVGAAPDKALIAGAVVFGGKKIIDSVKAAKDAFGPDK